MSLYCHYVTFSDSTISRSRLGKARASLPQEYNLARCIQGIENPRDSWNVNTTACSWEGIACDENQKVDKFRFWGWQIRGYLEWAYLPETLKVVDVSDNKLLGPLCIEQLPRALTRLSAYINLLSGSLNLCEFPNTMLSAFLYRNNFSESIDLRCLPQGMQWLSIRSNFLTGMLNLTELPVTMYDINVSTNFFHGAVTLDCLPLSMEHIDLSNNPDLTGVCNPSLLPTNLRHKRVGWFRFVYTVDDTAVLFENTEIKVVE